MKVGPADRRPTLTEMGWEDVPDILAGTGEGSGILLTDDERKKIYEEEKARLKLRRN